MKEIENINMKEIEEALEKATEEITKAKDHFTADKIDIRETMTKAQVEVNNAKAELKAYQEMVYGMEKDGLLDTGRDYIIEYKKGDILINGKKQSTDVIAKYRKYFKNANVTISKQDGVLNIDRD